MLQLIISNSRLGFKILGEQLGGKSHPDLTYRKAGISKYVAARYPDKQWQVSDTTGFAKVLKSNHTKNVLKHYDKAWDAIHYVQVQNLHEAERSSRAAISYPTVQATLPRVAFASVRMSGDDSDNAIKNYDKLLKTNYAPVGATGDLAVLQAQRGSAKQAAITLAHLKELYSDAQLYPLEISIAEQVGNNDKANTLLNKCKQAAESINSNLYEDCQRAAGIKPDTMEQQLKKWTGGAIEIYNDIIGDNDTASTGKSDNCTVATNAASNQASVQKNGNNADAEAATAEEPKKGGFGKLIGSITEAVDTVKTAAEEAVQ